MLVNVYPFYKRISSKESLQGNIQNGIANKTTIMIPITQSWIESSSPYGATKIFYPSMTATFSTNFDQVIAPKSPFKA